MNSTIDAAILDVATLLAFVAFGATCWYLRISYRISVVASLLFLVIAAVSVTVGQESAGNFVAILAYYALVVGVALAIVERRRVERAAEAAVEPSADSRAEEATASQSPAPRFRSLRDLLKRPRP